MNAVPIVTMRPDPTATKGAEMFQHPRMGSADEPKILKSLIWSELKPYPSNSIENLIGKTEYRTRWNFLVCSIRAA